MTARELYAKLQDPSATLTILESCLKQANKQQSKPKKLVKREV